MLPGSETNLSPLDTQPGLLDLEVTMSHTDPMAGSQFSVFVLITNPLDKPIWIDQVSVSLPSEIEWIVASQLGESAYPRSLEQVFEEVAKSDRLPAWLRLKNWLSPKSGEEIYRDGLLNQIAHQAFTLNNEIARDEAQLSEAPDEAQRDQLQQALEKKRDRLTTLRSLVVTMTGSAAVISPGNLSITKAMLPERFYFEASGDVEMADISIRGREATAVVSLPKSQALHPGKKAVATVILKTRKALLFRPIQYTLHFNVLYAFSRIESLENQFTRTHATTIAKSISIRSPITSVMAGAVLGGLAGFLARELSTASAPGVSLPPLLEMLVSGFVVLILSVVAVVFIARKSDAQSMVSVEDFWGGMVIGFLIGYTGSAAFETVSGINPGGASS